jgi:hypothetical protein
MKKELKQENWKRCKRCKNIPANTSVNLIDPDEDEKFKRSPIMEMAGMIDADLSSGYKHWIVECDLCGTRYLAGVDVEPFVWDVSFTREKDGVAESQFGRIVELRSEEELDNSRK